MGGFLLELRKHNPVLFSQTPGLYEKYISIEMFEDEIANLKQEKLQLETYNHDWPELAEEKQEEIELAKTGVQTQVITNNPISENANVQQGSLKIKNQTSYCIDRRCVKSKHNNRK